MALIVIKKQNIMLKYNFLLLTLPQSQFLCQSSSAQNQ